MEAFSARPHRRVQPLLCQPLRARCAGPYRVLCPTAPRGDRPLCEGCFCGRPTRWQRMSPRAVLEGTRLPSEGGPGRLECCEGGGVTGRCPAAPHRDPPKGFVQDVAPSPTSSW